MSAIHPSHAMRHEPGPYPPGEGAAQYADCDYHCRHLDIVCAAWWPTTGWLPVEEPVDVFDEWSRSIRHDACTACNRPVGHTEDEYEGAYGIRMVLVWMECWAHPSIDAVVLCEDCTCAVEEGRWQR